MNCIDYFDTYPEEYETIWKLFPDQKIVPDWTIVFRNKFEDGTISQQAYNSPAQAQRFSVFYGKAISVLSYLFRPDKCYCIKCWGHPIPRLDHNGSELIREFPLTPNAQVAIV